MVTTKHTHTTGWTRAAVVPGTDANYVNAGNVAIIGADVSQDGHGSIILHGIRKVSEH